MSSQNTYFFSNPSFVFQLTAGSLKWCMSRNNGAGIKFHPKKKEIRAEYLKYKQMRECLGNPKFKKEQLITNMTDHLKYILDMYLDNWDTGKCTLLHPLAYKTDCTSNGADNYALQHMACIVCLDTCNSVDSNIINCSGPAKHMYHSECYLQFLKSEENKDLGKKYKCERDTLCIACYQPMNI